MGFNTNTNIDIKSSLKDVKCHEDDVKYYKNYIRWRFSFHTENDNDKNKDCCYKPYYQLSNQEKYIVDLKYSTKINLVLWSKWNGAIIDEFSNGSPPVI